MMIDPEKQMASTDEKKLYEFSEQYLVKCPKI
jgi:hypothetical protein